MAIKIFVTGGTFDKSYDEINGQLFFNATHLPEILKMGRCTIPVEIKTLMMIDSLFMTEEHLNEIVQQCRACKSNEILITHGTDTMVETAAKIAKAAINKTIVITGAMIPYKFGSSDGLFNMGCALSFVQALPNGVYITMNGKCFTWNNVRKNRETGYFEEIK